MSSRRGLHLAVLLCLVGAFVVLVAAGRAWTSVEVPAGPLAEARTATGTGAELVPGVRALGLLGLAGVVALAATRSTGRTLVGVVLLLTGAGVVAAVVAPDLAAATLRQEGVEGAVATTAWPWLAVAGGLLLAAAGLLTAVRGRSWSALDRRYDAPAPPSRPAEPVAAAPVTTEPLTEKGLWEALDRGEDPTANLGTLAGPPADREADRT